MINNKRIVVVLPAYNAAKTLEKTLAEVPPDVVDEFLLVDDASRDDTATEACAAGNPVSRASQKPGLRRQSKDLL
jgi:glycosyltransferase involved in cell wall biosynthesis